MKSIIYLITSIHLCKKMHCKIIEELLPVSSYFYPSSSRQSCPNKYFPSLTFPLLGPTTFLKSYYFSKFRNQLFRVVQNKDYFVHTRE